MLALPTHPTLTHPITGEPLQALGWTRRGRLIWPQLGGALDGDGGDGDGDDGSAGDTGGDGGDNTGGAEGDKNVKIDGDFDADRAKRAIAAARDGEKKAKADAKAAQDRTNAILKAAGLTPDGKEDPEAQLKAANAERDANATEARTTAIELAVYKSAGKAGADPDAILDSRNFLKAVSELDPKAADFGDKVTAAIKAAVKANSKLAATTTGQGSGAGRQGADHTGGGNNRNRSTSLDSAVAKKLGG